MVKSASPLSLIGAPSSAGAYAPGQEKAPAGFRQAGIVERLAAAGIDVVDRGDVPGFRWHPDPASRRAMHGSEVARVAGAVRHEVAGALDGGGGALVIGGDCTVELGTVAGAIDHDPDVGLVYVDLDTDMNTPESTEDGALDWMGVAHMLAIEHTLPEVASVGTTRPLLRPDQLLFFGHDNVEPCERQVIDRLHIAEVPFAQVARDPEAAGRKAVGWARRFKYLLIHLDVDVLSYVDMPIAENVRRNVGLQLAQLMAAMTVLLHAPNLATLTITEVNPDHGAADGSTLRLFVEPLAAALSGSRFSGHR